MPATIERTTGTASTTDTKTKGKEDAVPVSLTMHGFATGPHMTIFGQVFSHLLRDSPMKDIRIMRESAENPSLFHGVVSSTRSDEDKLYLLHERYAWDIPNDAVTLGKLKSSLKILLGSSAFARAETAAFDAKLAGYPSMDWLIGAQNGAYAASGAVLNQMLKVPAKAPSGETLIKDDDGRPIAVFDKDYNIIFFPFDIPIGATEDASNGAAILLYTLIAKHLGFFDKAAIAEAEEALRKAVDERDAKELAKVAEGIVKNVFASGDLEQKEQQLDQQKKALRQYQDSQVATETLIAKLDREIEAARNYMAQWVPSTGEVSRQIASIRKIPKVEWVKPVANGLVIKTKPIGFNAVTFTGAIADRFYFGERKIELPEGKFIIGQFFIHIYYQDRRIKVAFHGNGFDSPRHPHATSRDSICWGKTMTDILAGANKEGDFVYLVTWVIKFLEQMHEGDNLAAWGIKNACDTYKWNYAELMEVAVCQDGKTLLDKLKEAPFILLKKKMASTDIFDSERVGGLSECSSDERKSTGHGRWMRILEELEVTKEKPKPRYRVMCNCGTLYTVTLGMMETDGTWRQYADYYKSGTGISQLDAIIKAAERAKKIEPDDEKQASLNKEAALKAATAEHRSTAKCASCGHSKTYMEKCPDTGSSECCHFRLGADGLHNCNCREYVAPRSSN